MKGNSDAKRGRDTERGEAAADNGPEEISEIGYRPSVNQAKDEPIPASHHDPRRRAGQRRDGGREQRG